MIDLFDERFMPYSKIFYVYPNKQIGGQKLKTIHKLCVHEDE